MPMDILPAEMSAIAIDGGTGGADALRIERTPVPVPAAGEILIRVASAGVNRPDIWQRMGAYAPPPGASATLGLEVAGEVVARGADAPRWSIGDRVTALLSGGGYAEFAVAHAEHALPIPHSQLTWSEAAALPETVFTVFANVFEDGALKTGESLLIHGATSGIGTMAIVMAKAAGARVYTTSRGSVKAEQARQLGADLAIDSSSEDFVARVKAEGGADVVLDMVGDTYTNRNMEVLRPAGRLIQIAMQAGAVAEINLQLVMAKRLLLTGSMLRPRSTQEKARLARAIEQLVWPWFENGVAQPSIDRTFPLAEAAAAHRYLEAGAHLGKVMLHTEFGTTARHNYLGRKGA